MKIYIYNVNNKNEYLKTIESQSIIGWQSVGTIIPVKTNQTIGKSFAFNKETSDWDIEIDDWRDITLYNKNNSKITKVGDVGELPNDYTNIVPPDTENQYVFNNNQWELYEAPRKTVEETIKEYENAIQNHIDITAQGRGYDNGYTCASYYDDKNTRYASDAKIFKDWRSDVWVYANEILNEFKAGQLGVIPTIEELIQNLPKIEWKD